MDDGSYAVCLNNVCKCPINRIASQDNRNCALKKELNELCQSDEQCGINSICRKRCECNNGFIISNNGTVCLKGNL